MRRHPTLSEVIASEDSGDPVLPVEWARGAAAQVLRWVWMAFDALRPRLSSVDFRRPLEQLERDLVQLHFRALQKVWAHETHGYSSLGPHHEWPEFESRSSAQARPPAYDLAFVDQTHLRWAWPLEAKVLRTAHSLSEYMGDVRDKFEAGIAAPLSGEGGMIGYLLSGNADDVFVRLEEVYRLRFVPVPEGSGHPQRTTEHVRASAPILRLHHLVMRC